MRAWYVSDAPLEINKESIGYSIINAETISYTEGKKITTIPSIQ